MASYFGRKALRIKNLGDRQAEKLVTEISSFIQLERIVKKDRTVTIYIASQLKNLVQMKILEVLNTYGYSLNNIEAKSTLLVITNIPSDMKDEEMDQMLTGFGRTLTRFQLVKWRNVNLKYGWIVFEDLENAEMCELALSTVEVKEHYLRAKILPETITSENSLQDLSTLQIEGFPAQFCNEEKIRDILKIICPDITHCVKFIRTKALSNCFLTRYIALVDWDSPQTAIESFVKLDKFKAADTNGDILINLKVSFALPGITAFSDFCLTIGENTANSLEVTSNVERNFRLPQRCAGIRGPPPPYVERESSPVIVTNTFCQPPPYTPPRPLMAHDVIPPQFVQHRNVVTACPTPPGFSVVSRPPPPLMHQNVFMPLLNPMDHSRPMMVQPTPPRQIFRPPPMVVPTQARVMQNGIPMVVQFANHFPPLNQATTRPMSNVTGAPNMNSTVRAVAELPRFTTVVASNLPPTPSVQPFKKVARQERKIVTKERHLAAAQKKFIKAWLRSNDLQTKTTSQNASKRTTTNTMDNNPTETVVTTQQSALNQSETESVCNESIADSIVQTTVVSICSPPSDTEATTIVVTPSATTTVVTPSSAWTQKKTTRRWSRTKKVNRNASNTQSDESIIEEVVKEYESTYDDDTKQTMNVPLDEYLMSAAPLRIGDDVRKSKDLIENTVEQLHEAVSEVDETNEKSVYMEAEKRLVHTTGSSFISTTNKVKNDNNGHNSEETLPRPNSNDPAADENAVKGNIMEALTRMSILDSKTCTRNGRATVDSGSSRLLTFMSSDEPSKERFWNRLPREMFGSLF